MRVSQALRYLLGLATLLIVVWAFVDLAVRLRHGEARGAPVTISIIHWGDPNEGQIMADLVAGFEREHPNVHVNRIHVNNDDYSAKLKTMFASGDPPDLLCLKPEEMPEMVALDLIRPLDEFFAPADLDRFFPKLIQTFRYDGHKSGVGKLYGIPKDFTTAVMYVNLDLFERAGVPVPYDGWTWDEYEVAVKKIRALATPQHEIYGGVFQLWDATLINILWTFGGDYFGKDFRDVTLDSPGSQRAMSMIRRLRLDEKTVYNQVGIAKDSAQEFIQGNVGVIGPLGRWLTPVYRSINTFRFDVVPVPYATERASVLFTNAWTITRGSKHPDEALELVRYLTSAAGQTRSAQLGLAIPADKALAYSTAFHAPGQQPAHSQLFLDADKFARIQQYPREVEFAQMVKEITDDCLQNGRLTVPETADVLKQRWLGLLDSPLRTRQFPSMNWPAITGVALAVFALLVAGLWWRISRERIGSLDRAQQRAGFAFVSPWVIGFLLLTIGPMALSLLLAFAKWTAMEPLGEAKYVGGANFVEMFGRDQLFGKSLWVTGYFVLIGVPATQVAALAVALLMNAKVRGITVFRTIYFVPSVVSGVALATLWLKLFNNNFGLINLGTAWLTKPHTWLSFAGAVCVVAALAALIQMVVAREQRRLRFAVVAGMASIGMFIAARLIGPERHGITPPDWFGRDAAWAAIPAFVIMGLWGVGGGMVIYLAGLKGVPQSLYEAATIDGAGPVRRLFSVTLPMLSPLIFFNLVMGMIGSFQIFTQAKVMTNGGPGTDTLFYVLNLYRQAFEFHNMGYASAMAWVLFLVVLTFTAIVFRGSRGLVHYEGLKA